MNPRILVVDDDSNNLELTHRVLFVEGYWVEKCVSGQAAEFLVKQAYEQGAPYDLILMDLNMPVKDGFASARDIVSRYHSNQPVIIAYTAMDESKAITSKIQHDKNIPVSADIPFRGQIYKPIDVDSFPNQISALLVRYSQKR